MNLLNFLKLGYNPPVKRTKEMCNQWVQLPTDANPGFNITNQGTLHMQSNNKF